MNGISSAGKTTLGQTIANGNLKMTFFNELGYELRREISSDSNEI